MADGYNFLAMLGEHRVATLTASLVLITFITFRCINFATSLSTTTLRGPPPSSIISGNLKDILDPNMKMLERWELEYGTAFQMQGLFGIRTVFFTDPVACSYIFSSSARFRKPNLLSRAIHALTGSGLLAVEGEQHKQQRRVLNPTYSPQQVKNLAPLMMDKAYDLRDVWLDDLGSTGNGKPQTMDVSDWMTRVTLDIIGEAGFGYAMNTIHNSNNELARAFQSLFSSTKSFDVLRMLGNLFPFLSYLPLKRYRGVRESRKIMDTIGQRLLAEKKAELLSDPQQTDPSMPLGNDLLSVLVKSNANDLPGLKLSDKETLAQVPTMITAGHETTASTLTWMLYALAHYPEVQEKLRDELYQVDNERPSLEEIDKLEYLDFFVKEIMRFHVPVRVLQRIGLEDEIIPLGNPVLDKDGRLHHKITVKAGTTMWLSTASFNWNKRLWGDDAHEFRPERFATVPAEVASVPSIWASLATFGAGPRACIGWRFALAEVKIILFVLVRAFKLEAELGMIVVPTTVVVTRPFVNGEPQLPLQISSWTQPDIV